MEDTVADDAGSYQGRGRKMPRMSRAHSGTVAHSSTGCEWYQSGSAWCQSGAAWCQSGLGI